MNLQELLEQKEKAESELKLADLSEFSHVDSLENGLQRIDNQIFGLLPDEIVIEIDGIRDVAHKNEPLEETFVASNNVTLSLDKVIKYMI